MARSITEILWKAPACYRTRAGKAHNHEGYVKVDGNKNPADVLTKLLDRSEFDVYHQELMYTDADQLRGVRE